jgi:hypothetical protein
VKTQTAVPHRNHPSRVPSLDEKSDSEKTTLVDPPLLKHLALAAVVHQCVAAMLTIFGPFMDVGGDKTAHTHVRPEGF